MHRHRVKVTLSDGASSAIRRLSKASGESMSGIISSLFNPNISELEGIAESLEQAARLRADLPGSARDVFRSAMSHISDNIEPKNDKPALSSWDDEYDADHYEKLRRDAERFDPTQAIEPNSDDFVAGDSFESDDYDELEPVHLDDESSSCLLVEPYPGFYDD